MIASSVIVGALLERRAHDPAGVPRHRHRSTRSSRSTSSCWCPSTCCASSPSCWRASSTASRCAATSTFPTEGAAILVCNHVSFVDPVLLMAASPRPIRFIMDHRDLQACRCSAGSSGSPRRSRSRRRRTTRRPTSRRSRAPARCSTTATCSASFPKAAITRDGELGEFKGGVMKLLESNPVPVVPLALQNLWGSFFSRAGGKAMSRAVPARPVQPRRPGRRRPAVRRRAVTPAACASASPALLARRLTRSPRSGGAEARLGVAFGGGRGRCARIPRSPGRRAAAASRAISRLSRTTIAVVSEP